MALLKAFVCQVILLGLYKMFLEQVVEEHLVPNELTRNCLVGFVCLVCFGIQLYTDKAEEVNAEADENRKAKSESRGEKRIKKSESAERSAIHEMVGSNASCRISTIKPQTTSQDNAAEKMPSNDKFAGDTKARSAAISPTEAEKNNEIGHSGIFSQFSPYMCDTISNVKADKIGEQKVPASNAQTSYDQETISTPVFNRFSDTNVYEESDEDGIEIDQFVPKESFKDEAQRLRKAEEIKAIKQEDVAAAVLESECLAANELEFSPTQDTNMITTLTTGLSPEAETTNGAAEKLSNNINASNIIEGNESNESVENERKIGNRHEMALSSKPDEHAKDIAESLSTAQEINTSSPSAKTTNVENGHKDNEEKLTLVETAVSSLSEGLTLTTARQNATASRDVCFLPAIVDISFIYACH